MYQFNPLKGLSIMLVAFAIIDYLMFGGRFTTSALNAIANMF